MKVEIPTEVDGTPVIAPRPKDVFYDSGGGEWITLVPTDPENDCFWEWDRVSGHVALIVHSEDDRE